MINNKKGKIKFNLGGQFIELYESNGADVPSQFLQNNNEII